MEDSLVPKESVDYIAKSEIQESWANYLSKNGAPIATVIEITNVCPNNCAHCYANISIGKNTETMSTNTFNNLLEIIANNNDKPEQIWLVGGEPTKHPKLKEYLQKTRELGFQAMVVTTGESFADKEYCEKIVPNADKIDITIRGLNTFHDLMMLPANDEIFSSIPNGLSDNDQIVYVTEKLAQREPNNKHFDNTIRGLENISDTITKTGCNTIIGLNVDIQATTNLYELIKLLSSHNIKIGNIILQIQTFSEDNEDLANILPNRWRKPTTAIIEEYISQAKSLVEDGLYNGNIEIIDPIPSDILADLKSDNVDLESIYNPTATPAIGPTGKLRSNVINEKSI